MPCWSREEARSTQFQVRGQLKVSCLQSEERLYSSPGLQTPIRPGAVCS